MLSKIKLISCVSAEFDADLVPAFLSHYQNLGVKPHQMHIIVNFDDQTNEDDVSKLIYHLKDANVHVYPWHEVYSSVKMWQKRRDIQKDVAHHDDWILSADIDEFHEYPKPLDSLLKYCEKRKIDVVQGVFVDRLKSNRTSSDVSSDDIFSHYDIEADVIDYLREGKDRGGTCKAMLFRAHHAPGLGGHNVETKNSHPAYYYFKSLSWYIFLPEIWFRNVVGCRVHHFKWRGNVVKKTQKRLLENDVSKSAAQYGKQVLSGLDANRLLDDTPKYSNSFVVQQLRKTRFTLILFVFGNWIGKKVFQKN